MTEPFHDRHPVPEYMTPFEKRINEALFGNGTEDKPGLVIDVRDIKVALAESKRTNIDIKKGLTIAGAAALFTQFLNWGKDNLR